MNSQPLSSRSTTDLAHACAQQASRRHTSTPEFDFCYELFRRAFASLPDNIAWQAILNQYQRLITHWLGQHATEDAVQDVFIRFWKSQQGAVFASRFSNIRTVMGYLKRCAVTVRIESGRAEEKRHKLAEKLSSLADEAQLVAAQTPASQTHAEIDFKQFVLSKLKDEREQAVFELTYYYNLTPREIQAERPDLFPNARTVYRVKENLLKRLHRDPEFRERRGQSSETRADDGGN
ncbi:MAG: sigma-70 family RNA polymerase sigma factor [Chloroflexi bacterium]|nr:sigma-70 family RNA polymerase sigma factor [Chloroflexota bacterium]